jgi:hypothetical protein
MIPDIEKFLPVTIFKMTATIPEKFNIVRYHQSLICGYIMMSRIDFLKMVTGRNFSMPEINSGHHNLATYEMSLKSDNVEFVRYCGGHFENGDR